jgi:DNA polymerase-3 subunit delta
MGMHCFEVLMDGKLPGTLPSVVAVVGDDHFLGCETITALLRLSNLESAGIRKFEGDTCTWGQIHDELASFSLFDPDAMRAAIVTSAGKLIRDSRSQLENWCESPGEGSLLILQVDSLPGTTKLHKAIDKRGWVIDAGLPTDSARSKAPSISKLKQWIRWWGKSRHGIQLKSNQSAMVLDAVGPICGVLDQELAKLALYADDAGTLNDAAVRQFVGTWSTRTAWEIADAVMDGKAAEALEQLARVFAAGEHPAAVLPQIAWSLRRYGIAAQLVLQSRRVGRPFGAHEAVKQSGFWGAELQLAPQRLRRLGLERASKILAWLAELDLKLKGSHSNVDRAIFAIDELCLRFSGAASK